MSLSSPYSTFIGVSAVTAVICIVIYCVRLNRPHQHIAPYPMQVVVVPHPDPQQLQRTQMCWTIPVEQPPPTYHAAVAALHTNNLS